MRMDKQCFSRLVHVSIGLLACLISTILFAADCGTDVWSGKTLTFEEYRCDQKGIKKIVIDGVVELRHPQDDPGSLTGNPHIVKVICGEMEFKPGAEIRSVSEIDLRIVGKVYGAILLKSTRGKDASDRPAPQEIYQESTAPAGPNGPPGGNGSDAETAIGNNHSSGRGQDGGSGSRGSDGKFGVEGPHGGNGYAASNVTFIALDYANVTRVAIEARGGQGNVGGKGGRGQNGGDGGKGGTGGKGGDGSLGHDGSSGGNGGNGGDGGDGGNGGKGGDGGAGGDGGRIILGYYEGGGLPIDWEAKNYGGAGGRGGEGGDPGEGGKGGSGGQPGCGGSDGSFLHIRTNPGGSCGTDGVRGQDGHRGKKGPPGLYGPDGKNGEQKQVDLGRFTKPSEGVCNEH